MRHIRAFFGLILLFSAFFSENATAQECTGPLMYNPFVRYDAGRSTAKTTALSLPFFEDFDGYDIIPDTTRWTGRQVYVNNTMCYNPVSRGCATFDALSQYGMPYDTTNPYITRYADSLTSKSIDLSSYNPGDSLYLSFVYQPGGNGFLPDRYDSLMLYFKPRTGAVWKKVWGISDTVNHDFFQAMIPVTDTSFFHADFQFRFVNKASIGINDDIWNVDYIQLAAGRNRNDTMINDVAFVQDPSPLLGDYTSMPYRQYIAASGSERAVSIGSAIRNNFTTAQSTSGTGFIATDNSGSVLTTASTGSKTIGGRSTTTVSTGTYSATPSAGINDRISFGHTFWMNPVSGDNHRNNDTITGSQVFDNYLAYDDGTAEMSYYLNLFPTLPGKLAIEHHLNKPDTLRGVAIYFGRQVPTASYKYVSLMVYESIAYGGSTTDKVLYQLDNQQPRYRDTINHFWIYKFDKPVLLPAGTFYIGTTQPALSGSDSLYFGLDRNRKTGNHAYFNVLNVWNASTVDGAIMIRPLLGQDIIPSSVEELSHTENTFKVYPNPASATLQVAIRLQRAAVYSILDIAGKTVATGTLQPDEPAVDISYLQPGSYVLTVSPANQVPLTTHFQKL
ncbi:T9SS type A sorting domain-containing protein [Rurimicrobium arvi]